MNPQINNVKELRLGFYNFIENNKKLFHIRCNEVECDPPIQGMKTYNLSIKPTEEISSESLYEHLSIVFEINISFLLKEYENLVLEPNENKLGLGILLNGLEFVIEQAWFKIFSSLKDFNNEKDDYVEISKIIQSVRGIPPAMKYGI